MSPCHRQNLFQGGASLNIPIGMNRFLLLLTDLCPSSLCYSGLNVLKPCPLSRSPVYLGKVVAFKLILLLNAFPFITQIGKAIYLIARSLRG